MKKILIAINSRYGSGGAEIGRIISEHYGITLYDRKLIEDTAKNMGFDADDIEHVDEGASSLLYSLSVNAYAINGISGYSHMPVHEKYYKIQCDVIKNAAERGSAVFIGRCADYILKDDYKIFSVYLCAPVEYRINRMMQLENTDYANSKKKVTKADKKRASNYSFRTGEIMNNCENYNLCLNTSLYDIESAAEIIIKAIDSFYKNSTTHKHNKGESTKWTKDFPKH